MKRLRLAAASLALTAALTAALTGTTTAVHHHAATSDDARDTTWACPTCITTRR